MPARVYELARDLNYKLEEVLSHEKIAGRLNSAFSQIPDDIEKELRDAFPSRDRNPCLDRTKIKVKRVRKKPAPKPKKVEEKIEEAAVPEPTSADLSPEQTDSAPVAEPESTNATETPAVNNEIQKEQPQQKEAQGAEPSPDPTAQESGSAKAAAKAATEAIKSQQQTQGDSLGKLNEGENFELGRIVKNPHGGNSAGRPPAPANRPSPNSRRRGKPTLEQRIDSSNTDKTNIYRYVQSPLPKKKEQETRGSKIQRMQLVYGHEIPKKERARNSERRETATTKFVELPTNIRDLSETVGIRAPDVIKFLMTQGSFLTITDQVDRDTVDTILNEFKITDFEIREAKQADQKLDELKTQSEDDQNLEERPPVVTIMGHVDHGKTTLLDTIRQSKLTEKEAGGITQHIGGYTVEKDGHKITFLDTPGHAAFTQIRARGANVTDLVILVVAANDGMMPQTEEAVNHAKAANVPIIVAVNKMDLPDSNPDRVKEQLAGLDLIPEEWSGSTVYVPVSALKGEGIDNLLEIVNIQAELLELKADYKGLAEGIVVEAHQEPGRGVVVSLLIQNGVLKKGDPILCGLGYGFLRQMENEEGKQLKEAGPSSVVKITGLSECPIPGDRFNEMPNIKKAKEVAENRQNEKREQKLAERQNLTVENFLDQVGGEGNNSMNIILKCDVQGSAEAIEQAIKDIGNDEVQANIIHRGVGAVSESDVLLAKTSEATILAFNVTAEGKARRIAMDEDIEIKRYSIIYELLDDVRAILEGLLSPEFKEEIVGEIEVRKVFRITGVGNIAGCYITKGYAERNQHARLIRDGNVVYTGKIQALRRFKDDVKRVEQRYECGIRLENYDDIREEDIIEPYLVHEIQKKLEE